MIRNGSKLLRFIALLTLCYALITGKSFAFSVKITPLELNQWYTLNTPATPIDTGQTPKMLKMQTHAKPYVSIYRYTLTLGEKYTIQAEYGDDYLDGSVCIWGVNPLAPNDSYSYPSGTTPVALCIHRSFPGGNVKGHVWGKRENFTVSPKSKHNYAWLAFYSSKPNVPLKIRMISPALPDDKIKKEGSYKKMPGKPTYYRWSSVRKDHLYLGYVKGEKPFLETATASSADAKTVVTGIAGQWELINAKDKPYGRLDLTQSGNQVQGRVHYDGGTSAAIRGTVAGNQANLVIINDNTAVLEGSFPKAVCKQIVGIKSYFDIELSPGSDEHHATLHGYYVRWDGNYRVTKTYERGTPGVEQYVRLSPRKIRRIGPPPPAAATPPPASPAGLSGWIAYISSGKPFTVIFDQTAGKFDDSDYTGDWRTDPMGTLRGGDAYQVTYKSGVFSCTGYNQHKRRVATDTARGIDPHDGLISLWGRTYAFDGKGRVWDQTYGIVGRLQAGQAGLIGSAGAKKDSPTPSAQILVSKQVPISGGTVQVNKPGDPLNGLSIRVADGSYPEGRKFTVSSSVVPRAGFGPHVNPVTPLITVKNGGGYAHTPMIVKIPVKRKTGYFAMPFFFEPDTGKLEGIPVIDRQEDHILAVTRHFSSFFVSEVAVSVLEGINRVDTGFTPGRDNWGYINRGTYSSPTGICSGMSMTAMWYYIERFPIDKIGLQQRFDNRSGAFATPGLEYDDAAGIRWASVAQTMTSSLDGRAGYDIIKKYEQKSEAKFDQGVWYGFAYAMLVTGEPQYLSIWGFDDAENDWYGHAIAAYGLDMEKGILYAYDPNFNPPSGRKIHFDRGISRFKQYLSALNAEQLQQGQGLPFHSFYYFGKSAIVNWNKMSNGWRNVTAGTAGKTLFPPYHWNVVNEKGKILARLDKSYTTFNQAIRIKPRHDGAKSVAYYPDDFWRVASVDGGQRRPKATVDRLTVDAEKAVATIPLSPGLNRIGVRVVSQKDQTYSWIGFNWFEITRADLMVRPADVTGTVDVPISFTIEAVEFPDRYSVAWQWGDDNQTETGTRHSAAHSWSAAGDYILKASVTDLGTGDLFAAAKARVTITDLDAPAAPAENPTQGCPENLRNWCRDRNYQGIKCLKCKAHDQSISGCVDCDFPLTYQGSGSWSSVFTSDLGPDKSSACTVPTPVRVVLSKDGSATVWLDNWTCVDRKPDMSPVCSQGPNSLPHMISGSHDGKGRVWFKGTDRNLNLSGRFDANSLSVAGSGRSQWDFEKDMVGDNISFSLSKNK